MEIVLNEKLNPEPGIYGIYADDKLVYIGSTVNLRHRYEQHQDLSNVKSDKNKKNMYKEFGNGFTYKKVEFKVLITMREIRQKADLRNIKEELILDSFEVAYIMEHKPKYNIEGVDTKYRFSHYARAF